MLKTQLVFKMSVLIIDIETTGLELQTHEITVIGTILYDPVKKIMVNIECFNVIINKIDENTQGMKRVAQILADCTSIVAFNGNKFDMPFILKWLEESPSCDIILSGIESKYVDFCAISKIVAKSYISLNNVCVLNQIQVCKSANGAQAVIWAREHEWKKLSDYCMQDVFVLLELTQHAIEHGLYFTGVNMNKRAHVKASEKILVVFDDQLQHTRACDKLLNLNDKNTSQQSLTKVCFEDVFSNQ